MEKEDQPEQKSSHSAIATNGPVSQNSKSSVPRFASFKPRQPAPPLAREKSAALHQRISEHPGKSNPPSVRDVPVKSHKSYGKEHIPRVLGEQNNPEHKEAQRHHKQNPSNNVGLEDARVFLEDRMGDDYNVRYGTLHQYNITKYREGGRHRILGLPRIFRTEAETEPSRRSVTSEWTDLANRGRENPLRTMSSKASGLARVVPLADNDSRMDASMDYLSLPLEPCQKRRKLDRLHSRNEIAGDLTYGNRHDPASVVSSDSSSDAGDQPAAGSLGISHERERHIHLSRSVKENPTNVDSWLALIHHEDLMLADNNGEPDRALTKVQRYGLAQVKLSMYGEAISKTKGQPGQCRLVHGMMDEGTRVWDSKKSAKQWKAVLKEHPNEIDLWTRHLDFEQASFMTFNCDSFQAILKNFLDMVAAKGASRDAGLTQIYLFLRLTTFMNGSGFSEHAHALWQAILEFSFFAPSSDQADSELSSFQSFWDSEVPRLGEEGACGWNSSRRVEVIPKVERPPDLPSDRNAFIFWSQCERQRMTASLLPARIIDEINEDDPYRMVLFSDIQPYLFRPSSAESRHELLEAFLCFCSLPPLRSRGLDKPSFSEDSFLSNAFLEATYACLDDWLPTGMKEPFNFPIPCFILDTTSLFAHKDIWFNPWTGYHSTPALERRRDWIQLTLQRLHTAFPGDEVFAEYLIALQSQIDVKQGRKWAKDLLKKRPSMRLYNAVALLEQHAGDFGDAERVWSRALDMRASFPVATQQETILIWLCWLWALLDRHEILKALRLIMSIPHEKVALDDLAQTGPACLDEQPTSKIRTLQYLTASLNHHLSLGNAEFSIHHLSVLSLFIYLTSNQTLNAALVHFETASKHPTVNQSRSALCLLHQSRARLLHLHARTSRSGFRPSDVTNPLAESIRLFPSNTIFLSLYHFHTRRFLLTDRIRDVTPTLIHSWKRIHDENHGPASEKTGTGDKASIIPALFQIWVELNRPSFAGSTSHSIRATFENHLSSEPSLATPHTNNQNSVSHSPALHSPAVWKLYILWEIHVASQQQRKQKSQVPPITAISRSVADRASPMMAANQVLHRAIRACPWAKEIYMLAFEKPELREAMTAAELKGVWQMMVDKELRLHVDSDLGDGAMRSPH